MINSLSPAVASGRLMHIFRRRDLPSLRSLQLTAYSFQLTMYHWKCFPGHGNAFNLCPAPWDTQASIIIWIAKRLRGCFQKSYQVRGRKRDYSKLLVKARPARARSRRVNVRCVRSQRRWPKLHIIWCNGIWSNADWLVVILITNRACEGSEVTCSGKYLF